MNKVLVVGYFGYTTNKLDGQTVKTRDVYKLVAKQFNGDIDYFDTEIFKYNRLAIVKMFGRLIRCRTLFYLPAQNNLKYIFPLIYVLSILFRVRIHYFVVGGWLREFIMSLPLHRYMLRRIEGIHVETKRLKKELEDYFKYDNVDIFPNFRFFDFNPKRYDSDQLRLVFMARIMKEKGIDWIFNLAEYIEENGLRDKISITFYGPIVEDSRIYFEKEINRYTFVNYNGSLDPSEIHKTLCQYDVMLLPTHFYTEGLPGSVVDAYISGIPVIVTEWKHSHEFIDNGESGFIIPFDNGQDSLREKVLLLYNDRALLHQLQANALHKRMEFAPPTIDKFLT